MEAIKNTLATTAIEGIGSGGGKYILNGNLSPIVPVDIWATQEELYQVPLDFYYIPKRFNLATTSF